MARKPLEIRLLRLLLVIAVPAMTFSTLLCASAAFAAEHYVDFLSGNDDNNGAIGSPYKTIAMGLRRCAPGDTVNLRGGIHEITQPLTEFVSGLDAEHPTILQSYLNEPVTIKNMYVVGAAC
ncbi:MAG: hypothetical protein R3C68_09970 [Myxococcota bacterium]